ncbi:TfuA-like protein [Bradyrhizobium sp. SZCCHNR1015]|uniref:TfuA-like protein n=1 Tax=Bradyrhizobium sp. SZCCHNR1015 TaxID=3057338 RepID=UPI002916261C|nr:TfuA-like protein [Bradyrhizobium sp. SZCCHNR1015]
MTCIVFTGPTLHPRDAALELEAEYLPPVQQGDVYRAALAKPAAIGIIDGYFEQVPSVWHKEILWAMASGIHVFGSASMGALRAAELHAFGMEGVGKVFAAYRDGVFEADDEVALIHGPAELGFPALSEPLVNIRFTLQKAVAAGVISEASRQILEALGKASFYPERSYPALLQGARSDGRLTSQEIAALEAWLPDHRIDQKREDALEMLRTMRRRFAGDVVPKAVEYAFEHTQLWDGLIQDAQRSAAAERESGIPDGTPQLMDELRLLAARGGDLSDKAIARFLAASEAKRRGVRVDAQALSAEIIRFRQSRDLMDPAELEAWIARNGLTRSEFLELMLDEARIRSFRKGLNGSALNALADWARIDGHFEDLLARARDKCEVLKQTEIDGGGCPADFGISEDELMARYLPAAPDDGGQDEAELAGSLGFPDRAALIQALLREHVYTSRKS